MRILAPVAGPLVGRDAQTRRLDGLVAAVREGRGEALVVRGGTGIGKSALLEHAVAAADGFQVMRAAGSEFERELPFAALHQLCAPILDRADEIPVRHREALRVAFGLVEGAPDLFRIGLAVLDLLTAAAGDRPVLCVLDDAHWLDTASSKVLVFLARRVAADPVAILFGARAGGGPDRLAELPGLAVGGLADEDARTLLAARSPFPLDERVRDRLVAEADGNPLALLELPRAGGFAPPGESPVSARLEIGFQVRLAPLSVAARTLLTLAAADPTGDPGLLWPAARELGINVPRVAAEVADSGLAEFASRVRFCHPVARSAVYQAATAGQRRVAHGVLAGVTDPLVSPDRRAWHRALASAGPDDEVAADLARSAARAQARGGVAAAAAFLERAAVLSLDPGRRLERTLTAAQANLDAGAIDVAAQLLDSIETAGLNDFQSARIDVLRGRIAFTRDADNAGPAFMVRAGRRLAAVDPERSRDCFLDALEMALVVGRAGGVIDKVITAAESAPPAPQAPDLLDALSMLACDGYARAVPVLRSLLDSAGDGPAWWARRPALAVMIAAELWDTHTHTAISGWLEKAGRESGSPQLLRLGLGQQASDALLVGDLGRAVAAAAEEQAIAEATGEPPLQYFRLLLAATRGDRTEAAEVFAAAAAGGSGQVTNLHWTTAMFSNGVCDYPAALAAARAATSHGDLFLFGAALPELVEAAVHCGETTEAVRAANVLTDRAHASGSVSGLGIAAYAQGLATGIEDHYREACDRLAESPLLPNRGRAHLLYGEWLRRQGRRRDSIRHLNTAYDLLSAAGAGGFARRAAAELRAAGERMNRGVEPPHRQLTMQETAVARLVAAGASSQEVAVHLFISKRTVDAHLRNIFRKLGVTSRRQLRQYPGLT